MRWLLHRLRGGISGSTLLVTFWQAQRLLLQAAWLVLVARLLGPGDLGGFVGLIGLATTLGGVSGLGFGLVMFRDAVRDPSVFGDRLRSTLAVTLGSGAVLGLVFVGAAPLVTASDASPAVLLAIAFAELIALPVTAAGSFAFAAHERMGWSAGLPALLALARLLASAGVWMLGEASVARLAMAHAIGSGAAAVFGLAAIVLLLRPAPGGLGLRARAFRDGLGFCSSWAGTNALSSLDKAMVLRWGGGEVSGHYSVAYRIAAIFAMPIEALTTSATPRLFRSGHAGNAETGFIGRLLLAALGYGALAAGFLWFVAPLAALLFGRGYEEVASTARTMALFVPLYGLRVLGANILLARGEIPRLAAIQAAGVAVMLALGAALIPVGGLAGSVYTIIATEVLLGLLIWTSVATGGTAAAPHHPPADRVQDNLPINHFDRTQQCRQ